MQIKISLPNPNSHTVSTYAGVNGYLKQLELAVHHAQKAVESFKKDNGVEELSEDSCITIVPDYLEKLLIEDARKDIKVNEDSLLHHLAENGLGDKYYTGRQYIDLIIELEPKKKGEK